MLTGQKLNQSLGSDTVIADDCWFSYMENCIIQRPNTKGTSQQWMLDFEYHEVTYNYYIDEESIPRWWTITPR